MTSTAVVLNTAGQLSIEEQLVARRIAGVLVGAGADLLVAQSQYPAWRPGLPGRAFPAEESRPARRRAIEAAVLVDASRACGCVGSEQQDASPATETAWLDAAGGRSRRLAEFLDETEYECLVLIGLTSALTVELSGSHKGRRIVVPLRSPDLNNFPRTRAALEGADAVLATNAVESDRLRGAGSAVEVTDVGMAFHADVAEGSRHPAAPEEPYVLLVGEWSDTTYGPPLRRTATRLARHLRASTGLDVVLLTEEFIYPHLWPSSLTVRAGGSRRDLWQWMQGALVTVDLNSASFAGRDAAEALLCGAPIIVPTGSAACDHVQRCDGGIWYRHLDDVVAAIQAMEADPSLRVRLGRQGRDAAAKHFDPAAFTSRVLEASGMA